MLTPAMRGHRRDHQGDKLERVDARVREHRRAHQRPPLGVGRAVEVLPEPVVVVDGKGRVQRHHGGQQLERGAWRHGGPRG